jgi:hypothetical protein
MADFRAVCEQLANELQEYINYAPTGPCDEEQALVDEARALLAQPKPAPKPVVDYSRVPEIATEAEIRAAAQYLVKKRHCDGDLIPAIEYAIARWGRPVIKPTPTDEELLQLAREWNSGYESIEFEFIDDYARAVLARWGNA